MIEVNKELTLKVAELARLELSEKEAQTFTQQISDVLKYVDKLREVDVSQISNLKSHEIETLKDGSKQIAPLNHGLPLRDLGMATPLREDVAYSFETDENGKPKVLKTAPETLYDGYKVPPII